MTQSFFIGKDSPVLDFTWINVVQDVRVDRCRLVVIRYCWYGGCDVRIQWR